MKIRATEEITETSRETAEIIGKAKRDSRDYKKKRETGEITKKGSETVEITIGQCHST